MDPGLHHGNVLAGGVVDVHGNSGDIDSLLSGGDPSDHHVGNGSNGSGGGSVAMGDGKSRRLLEPYERHRAHDLRAECYRRGIRPIKKGPNANDNKNGYIVLLRKYDGTSSGLSPDDRGNLVHHHHSGGDEDDLDDGDSDNNQMSALTKKRKLPMQHHIQQHLQQAGVAGGNSLTSAAAVVAAAAANDLAGFYDTSQAPLVPVLPMQYPANLAKAPSNNSNNNAIANPTTTDLEILSGIANSYTTQMGGALTGTTATATGSSGNGNGTDLCGNCRTVVSDQLMESIRLGRNKMQMLEYQRLMELRDKDTIHLKEIITVLRDLRQCLRDAQKDNRLTHELLVELEDDIAFFQTLKERTKERMRREMQDARERQAKQANAGNVGTT